LSKELSIDMNHRRDMLTADYITNVVKCALDEDVRTGDLSADLLPADKIVHARLITRERAVVCGCDFVDAVFKMLDEQVSLTWLVRDGDRVQADTVLCALSGTARALLTGERTALNFLQLLSGTATTTQHYVSAIQGTSCQILDTRKTIPGLRLAQKYAVLCGGGVNHRFGLYDVIMIKENHKYACGSITQAVAKAREIHPDKKMIVEVENLVELQEALGVGVEHILLDNFSLADLSAAVNLNQHQAKLEASGGADLDSILTIARTGVDFISVGAITKHVRAIDLSLRVQS
jgi:nicotinate-nucleotide pyrophosphorylase (carboxylating)